jgi:hypothetical protein
LREDSKISRSGRAAASLLLADRYRQTGDAATAKAIEESVLQEKFVPQWFRARETRELVSASIWHEAKTFR